MLVPVPSARRVSLSSYCLFVKVMDMVLRRYKNALFKSRILIFFISQPVAHGAIKGHAAAWSLCPEEEHHCHPSVITLLLCVCFH